MTWVLVLLLSGVGQSTSVSAVQVPGFVDIQSCAHAGAVLKAKAEEMEYVRATYACAQVQK